MEDNELPAVLPEAVIVEAPVVPMLLDPLCQGQPGMLVVERGREDSVPNHTADDMGLQPGCFDYHFPGGDLLLFKVIRNTLNL